MDLTIVESSRTGFRAGYSCPCGCTPSVAYERGAGVVTERCCCGNQFAVGRRAGSSLTPVDGFRLESAAIASPWGEGIEAAWLIGPSVHAPAAAHEHHGEGHGHHDEAAVPASDRTSVIDPVCGMTVEPEMARAKGLSSSHRGRTFYFCGKGCKLEFDDDPERYLDPAYVPSM